MRFLIRLGDDVDLLDPSLLVDFAGEAVLARPFMRRPRSSFLRRRILVVLALEAERLVAPRQLQEAEDLFESLAIDAVGFALVAGGRGHVDLLRHLVEPARLVTAREADERPALGQLIQPCDFEREPQRIPPGQHVADRADLDPFGVVDHVLRQHWQAAHLEAFAVQMMLREADRIEADFLGQLRDLHHFFDHALPAIGTVRDRAQGPPLFERGRKAGQEKVHEFHRGLPPTSAAILGRIIRPLCSEMLSEERRQFAGRGGVERVSRRLLRGRRFAYSGRDRAPSQACVTRLRSQLRQ